MGRRSRRTHWARRCRPGPSRARRRRPPANTRPHPSRPRPSALATPPPHTLPPLLAPPERPRKAPPNFMATPRQRPWQRCPSPHAAWCACGLNRRWHDIGSIAASHLAITNAQVAATGLEVGACLHAHAPDMVTLARCVLASRRVGRRARPAAQEARTCRPPRCRHGAGRSRASRAVPVQPATSPASRPWI